jgi:lipopolysaccharide heptosyltransferase II
MNTMAISDGRARLWHGLGRVLLVRLDGLGDVLMTTPALAAVREGLPKARLTLLTSEAGAQAADHLTMVDEVWAFNAPWMRGPQESLATASRGDAEQQLIERLRSASFDAAIIFTVCTQSALPMAVLCRMAGIPLCLAHNRENPYALLSDWQAEVDVVATGMRHEVQRQLALVAALGFHTADDRLRFAVKPKDRSAVQMRLSAAGLKPLQPYVVVHPGATASSRRWPAGWFGTAAQVLAVNVRCVVVFCGDEGDVPLVEEARASMTINHLSFAAQLNLGELAALIEGALLLVANNSAPMHLAAAVGTPVVSLYALTNPQHTPWRVPARVLSQDVDCRWCLKSICPKQHHLCLNAVEPQAVADAGMELVRMMRCPAFQTLQQGMSHA